MLHLPALITDLALVLSAAAVTMLIFKKLKQPVVLGYIIAGLLVGPKVNLLPTVVELHSIRTWADIGVIFLLFGLGLEFSIKKLFKVGGVAVITAFTGVTLTMLLGYGVGTLLGWNNMDRLFLGGLLSIASTTIIIRAFEELGVRSQKFTGIVTGVLVVEDLVAVVLMAMLSTLALSEGSAGAELFFSVFKLIFLLVLWFVCGIFFLPTILEKGRKLMNEESLLMLSLALCFLMVVLATASGFSPALGAFMMGSILSETNKAEKIERLVKPIKTLFGAIFFVSVGMLIDPKMLALHKIPILAASLVLLFGKPLFVVCGALLSGQPLKIAVQTGMSLSQIGEFSFIIATLGLTLGVTSDFLYPVAVAVSVITTFTTPYMIRLSPYAYEYIETWLPEKWKRILNTYSVDSQNVKITSDWKLLLRFSLINMGVFSVIIVTIIYFGTDFIGSVFMEHQMSRIITAFATLVVLSPFLWALAFRRTQRQAYANVWVNPSMRGPLVFLLFLRVALAVFYIGFLFDRLFSPMVAVIGATVTCVILLLFFRKIKSFYAKIELRFLNNLHGREERDSKTAYRLSPWDTHLSSFELSAQSPFIGKTLMESGIREEFGINIAIIKRGNTVINVPSRNERLYPNDVLSVIGTDEQLDSFRHRLELLAQESEQPTEFSKVVLQHFRIGKRSKLQGKSIRGSGIRELSKGLVVGIERREERILNPESDTVFELNDIVWIVGNEKRIQVLAKEGE